MTNTQRHVNAQGLFMAIEVSERIWRLAFTDLASDRQVEVEGWNAAGFRTQLAKAKKHFGLAPSARVRSCCEAGRAGFSLHRFLESQGVENVVVDPSGIEASRRAKHRKTDRLDAEKLVRMLVRYWVYGERRCWQACRAPTPEREAARRLDREYDRLKKERTGRVARIKSLQFFGWRQFANRREVGAAAGLTGAPFMSGKMQADQGIAKAGHARIRTLAVELAWGWLRRQPKSALSEWFCARFALGGKRMRRIGIVALARKLLVALCKYLKFCLVPEGAALRT